jgi:hypothetical protein
MPLKDIDFKIEQFQNALNTFMPKKYKWFKNIELHRIVFYDDKPNGVIGLNGDMLVDGDWYGTQFRNYHYSSNIINPNLENISIGDIVGGKFAVELSNLFKNVYRGVTGRKVEGLMWHLLFVSIPDEEETNNEIDSVELDEYARTLKNARRQGSGLRFSKTAIKSNPNRFRPQNRKSLNEIHNDLSIQRRLKKPVDYYSIKSLVKTEMYNLNVFDYENEYYYLEAVATHVTDELLPVSSDTTYSSIFEKIYDYIINEFGDNITTYWNENNFDSDELYENTELTEKCWKGYTQKGMKTMFGKRYPNCVKVKKK